MFFLLTSVDDIFQVTSNKSIFLSTSAKIFSTNIGQGYFLSILVGSVLQPRPSMIFSFDIGQ